ncbi:2,3-bisphosphoglycerate-independent phosphoglycerate mutase [Candidatus Uhrbacteria bacterium]|nr:2,3-bisphosphoglycerate-independent phosphoglycerate mutase [Candidatus Uhrbacteria bacterium]
MTNEKRPKPVVLIILDGWGVAPPHEGNAIARAKKPRMDAFVSAYPAMTLIASSREVGLDWGKMGNSEVGHLNIGAGRVYYQTLPRINRDIEVGEFAQNQAFLSALDHAKNNKSKLHLISLVSAGGVHSSLEHLFELLLFCKKNKFSNVFVQAILDGRDTIYNTGIDFVMALEAKMKELKVGKIATLSGRYYAMDRDNRWDRVNAVYAAMADGVGAIADSAVAAIEASYANKVYDEEFVPTVIAPRGVPAAKVEDGDAAIFVNFRPDRARQLTRAFVMPNFTSFSRRQISNLYFVTMTEYEHGLPVTVAYPPEVIATNLAQVISENGLKQLHIAETEKYAHVTFFLNGTIEEPYKNEDRAIVPSPRVSSYDQKPEMSAPEIAKRVVKEINADKYDFIALNFANADMVGHTGSIEATIKGIEATDAAIGEIVDAALAHDGVALITADHGNGEEVTNLQTGEIDKEHSTNPVPFIIIGRQWEGQTGGAVEAVGGDLSLTPPVGMLADVAPTVLKIMGLPQPEEMTGRALI